ncbi:hypothetical protein BJX99DRAFT_260697 [Aspergillus californicus]
MNPPMPYPHHMSAHPGERPQALRNSPSGSMSPDDIVNQMNRLHVQQTKFSPSNEARSANIITGADVNEQTGACYIGYTFSKAESTSGSRDTWKKVDKVRMNLSQDDLIDLVQKKSKRIPVANQYQSLTLVKRPHVDRAIEDLRQSNPHFHWMCVYVREIQRDVKGKSFRRDYETTSMDVIIMGKPIYQSPTRERVPAQLQRPSAEDEPRPFSRMGPQDAPWGGPSHHPPSTRPQMLNVEQATTAFQHHEALPSHLQPQQVTGPQFPQHRPSPPPFNPQHHVTGPQYPQRGQSPHPQQNTAGPQYRQPGPLPSHLQSQHATGPQYPQHTQRGPSPPHPQLQHAAATQYPQHGPSPPPPLPQQVTTEPQVPQQGPWLQNTPNHPPHHGTVVHNHINQAPVPTSRPDAENRGMRPAVVKPDPKSYRQEMPHQNISRNQQTKANQIKGGQRRGRSPKLDHGSAPELVFDSASSEDEETWTPGQDDEDSEVEFSERNSRGSNVAVAGSNYRSGSSAQPRHGYRTHYRREPQRSNDHGFGRYPKDATVDLIPNGGNHVSRRPSKTHRGVPQCVSQQSIIHQQPSPDDLDVLVMNQLRGRTQNDIRSRMLTHWEADLEERENLIEYQKQMLKDMTIRNDRIGEMGFLGPRPLREPMPAYPRGYLQRTLQ